MSLDNAGNDAVLDCLIVPQGTLRLLDQVKQGVQFDTSLRCDVWRGPCDEYGSHNLSTLDHAIDQDNVRIDFNQRSENILVVPGPRHLSGD